MLLSSPVAPQLEAACARAGFLVNAVAPDAIRLAPPLVLTSGQASRFTTALPAMLASIAGDAAAPGEGVQGSPFITNKDDATGAAR